MPRERSSGAAVRRVGSSVSDSPRATSAPITPTAAYTRSMRCGSMPSAGTRAAASAPAEPARVATVLYSPNRRVGSPPAPTALGSIACSSDVNGPDSTTSVETVPLRAASTRSQISSVSANAMPARPMRRKRAAYQRRRPTRSAVRAIATDVSATPARSAARTSPTSKPDSPLRASVTPMRTLPRP